jgi:hypothetical protein
MVNIAIILGFILLIIWAIILVEFINAPSEEDFFEACIQDEIAYLKSQPQTKKVKLRIQKLQQKL